jgi:hypothetical protein
MTDPADKRKNRKATKVAIGIAIIIASVGIMFAPIIPVSYEEIVGDLGDSDQPVGKMVTKNVSAFQIITGTE